MLARFNIGAAFRYSRNIVGGITGFIFSIGNIFKTPFHGKWPASFIGALGVSICIFKLRENYRLNKTVVLVEDYKQDKIHSSTLVITDLLLKDAQKFKKFLINSHQESKEPDLYFSHIQLEDILAGILNSNIENKYNWINFTQKILYGLSVFLAHTGSHFMECLLLKAYENPDLFDFNEVTADNVLIIILSILSLYNGYQSVKEHQMAFDKADIDEACESFLKTYR